mmetsp:Transcript_53810/g.112360  ORF Transcript_53810/g.112360 Transcript_53810/m.112360 type:complete len:219 (-) Transcript_53810:2046-2702(-)
MVQGHEEVGENNRNNGHELHDNVEGRAGGILEGIADGISDHSSSMGLRFLASVLALASIDSRHGEIAVHDLLVLGRVRLLDIAEPLANGHVALLASSLHFLRQASIASADGSLRLEAGLIAQASAIVILEPAIQLSLLRVLLGIVPRAAGVAHADGELNRRHNGTGEQARDGLDAAKGADEDGRSDDEDAGGDHLAERRLGGDVDTLVVVGLDQLLAL